MGEELIELESKIQYCASVASLVGGAIGIALAYLHLSYVPLCVAQIVIVIIMTAFDYVTFKTFKQIPVVEGVK